jgi:hypothetical protein
MAWYDGLQSAASWLTGTGQDDPNNPYRNALNANAQAQTNMGQQLGNAYNANQSGINNTIGMLQATANGANSVSAEQLRQGLQQSQAQQMSMAASATPQNQAMAARTAMNNAGGQASGMMGQQAMAGLQERQGAMNSLAQLQTQQAQMNMQGSLGAYGMANGAYGTIMQNPQKQLGPYALGALGGAAAAAAPFMTGGMGGGGGGGGFSYSGPPGGYYG